MEIMPNHKLQVLRFEHLATDEQPFRFVDSGLPNVYLVGIRYFTYEDGRVVAEIPALKSLMKLIARDLVERPDSLSGAEIRFLRKRLGKRAVDFARELGIEAETLSRFENDKQEAGESLDKLIRLVYAVTSDDPELVDKVRPTLDSLLAAWKSGPANVKIVKKIDNNEWTDVPKVA
jgi:putative transcriptional regulator